MLFHTQSLSPSSPRFVQNRQGMSLLEVLVALGILAAGLASVASLLPAAGARLGEANAIDRAGALAANIQADRRICGSLVASMFSGTTPQAVVAGDMFSTFASSTSGAFRTDARLLPTLSLTQDDLQLAVNGNSIGLRDPTMSFGVTVVPLLSTTTAVSAGAPVRVSVVTFKKASVECQPITLTIASGTTQVVSGTNAAIFTNGNNAAADAVRRRFLNSCAWVLAAAPSGTARPAWLQIGGSWTTTGSAGISNGSFISFSDPERVSPFLSGNALTVYGFTNILRLDERPATLR